MRIVLVPLILFSSGFALLAEEGDTGQNPLPPSEAPPNAAPQNQERGGTHDSDANRELRKGLQQRFKNLSPEEKKQVMDFRKNSRDMTPEQREAEASKIPFFQQMSPEEHQMVMNHLEQMKKNQEIRKKIQERWKNLSPEEKQQMKDFREKAKNMTPEERKEAIQKLPLFKNMTPEEKEFLKKGYQRLKQMTPEQREKLKKNLEKWRQMTPEEREQMRQKFQQKNEENSGRHDNPIRGAPEGSRADRAI